MAGSSSSAKKTAAKRTSGRPKAKAATLSEVAPEELRRYYRDMLLIRRFEERSFGATTATCC
jgi:TPP-dependent pyruvate/acetoin dehydrogenase alpha subunit